MAYVMVETTTRDYEVKMGQLADIDDANFGLFGKDMGCLHRGCARRRTRLTAPEQLL